MSLTVYRDLEQGSDEWLQARAGILTASVIGQLITPKTVKPAANDKSRALVAELVAERITGRVEETYPSRDMERGTLLEPYARDLYATHFAPVEEVGFGRLDTDTFTLGASPDGLVGDDGGTEIKAPRAKTHLRTVITDQVPLEYMAQVQTSLLVFDRAWWDFVSYCPGMPLFVKRVHPDPVWRAALVAVAEQFEVRARELIRDFTANTRNMPPTDYFDPFEEEEMTF